MIPKKRRRSVQSGEQQRGGRYVVGVLALLLLASSRLAIAEPMGPGGYFGLGFGQSTMNDANNTLLGTTTQDQDTALKIFGGMMFNPNIGLELGYVDFGRFIGAAPHEEWHASGVDVSLVVAAPLPSQYSNFSVFAKVGMNAWNVDDDISSFGSISASGTSPSYGLGAEVELNRRMGLNVQWERFADVGDFNTTGRSDIDLVSANFVYHFRPVEYPYPYRRPRRGRY
jgi:OmpA-OmpF porin, OOP family